MRLQRVASLTVVSRGPLFHPGAMSKRDRSSGKDRRPLNDSAGFGGTLGDLFAARGLAPSGDPDATATTPEACSDADGLAPESFEPSPTSLAAVGPLTVRVDRKGRGGKVVTLVAGLPEAPGTLEPLARSLRRLLACGVATQGGQLVIQGDQASHVAAQLRRWGAPEVRGA